MAETLTPQTAGVGHNAQDPDGGPPVRGANGAIEEAQEASAPQQWAIVEIFGHRRHVGIVSEAEQYGSKMLRIDVPTADGGAIEATFFYGGTSIFGLTPITEERGRAELKSMRRPEPARLGLYRDPDMDDDGDGHEPPFF